MNRFVTVLRSGGEYTPAHVRAMQRQVAKWAPDATFACLSDVKIEGVETIPLKHDWPGWFTKIELFRPDIPGEFLYSDLDNVIVGPLDDLWRAHGHFVTNGKYCYTGCMYVPERVRRVAWEMWLENPDAHMADASGRGRENLTGDELFIKKVIGRFRQSFDDWAPGQVVFAAPIFDRRLHSLHAWVPQNERVVICAGPQQRPWKHSIFQRLGMYEESV